MWILIVLAILSFNGLACQPETALDWPEIRATIAHDFPDVAQISTHELQEMLESEDGPPLLLDARSEIEFAVSHLRGARLVSSESEMRRLLENFALDQPIVVYCSVGIRSSRLVESIESLGFRHVRNLDGSIFVWANEGRSLVGGAASPGHPETEVPTDRVHPFNERWGQLLQRDRWSWKPALDPTLDPILNLTEPL